MAMEMGNIELMVTLQVSTYIHESWPISATYVKIEHVWFTDRSHQLLSGLGFSHRKPVFPVQNGINWD